MCLCLFLHFAQSILQCQRAKRGVCGFSPPPRYNVLRKGEQQRKQGSAAKSVWRYKATEINLIQTGHRCVGGVGGELLSWERSHDHKKPRWLEWWGNETNGKGMDNSPRLLGKAMLTQSPKLRLATMTLRGKKHTLILSALDVCDDVSAGVGLLLLINLHLTGRVTLCSATSLSLANIFAPV